MEKQQVQSPETGAWPASSKQRRGHSGWGRMNKGRRRRFSPERPQNPVMSLTGASLGTADTSPRPTPGEYLPAFLLWIFRYFQKLTSCSYALALFRACWAGLPSNDRRSLRIISWVLWVSCPSSWPHPTASSPVNQGMTDRSRALWNMQWLASGWVKQGSGKLWSRWCLKGPINYKMDR